MSLPPLPEPDRSGFPSRDDPDEFVAYSSDAMLAFYAEGFRAGMERADGIADGLEKLCGALLRKGTEQDGNWGWPSFYDEVQQIKEAMAAIRAAAKQGQWGASIIGQPEYQAEQREKSRKARALMDDAAKQGGQG